MKGTACIRYLATLGLGLLCAQAPGAYGSAAADTAALDQVTDVWDGLLAKHVRPHGGVDYAGFAADLPQLKSFLDAHARLSLQGASDGLKKATYINLYNAGMIFNVLSYGQMHQLTPGGGEFLALKIDELKVPGGNLWNGDLTFALGGERLTLDDIEHRLLRGVEPGPKLAALAVTQLDPRLHAAVNCAAFSCPRLRASAFRAATVEQTLQQAMQEFVGDPAQFHQEGEDKLQMNSIILWYYSDFDDYGKQHGGAGAGDYLAGFVQAAAKDYAWKTGFFKAHLNDRSRIALKLTLDFFYNWQVNDVQNKP